MYGHASYTLDDMLCAFYLQWDGKDTQDHFFQGWEFQL